MKEKASRELNGLLKGMKEVLFVFAGLVTIGGIIPLASGNTRYFLIYLLVLAGLLTACFWSWLLYIYWARVEQASTIIDPTDGNRPHKVRKRKFPKPSRRRALAGLILIPVLALSVLATWHIRTTSYQQITASKVEKFTVLIADIDESNSQDNRSTDIILNQLRKATEKYGDVKIEALGKVITEKEGSEYARALGKERGAHIVLWGWIGKTPSTVRATIHFEVLQGPRILQLATDEETVKMVASDMESFTIQEQLSGEMSYLTLLTLGMIRYEVGDYDEAIRRLSDAIKQPSVPKGMVDPEQAYFYRGTSYLRKQKFETAIEDLSHAIQLQPSDAAAYVNRGMCYAWRKQFKEAREDFNEGIRRGPNDNAYYNRGQFHLEMKEHELAISDFTKSIEINPSNGAAFYFRGAAHKERGEYDQAISDYDKAINIGIVGSFVYLNRGYAHEKKGKLREAFVDYNMALMLDPNNAYAYNYRGALYTKTGDYRRAMDDLNRALIIKPDYAMAYHLRGITHLFKKEVALSIADLNRATELDPNDALAYRNLGMAHIEAGEDEKAIADFNQAIKLDPKSANDYIRRAVAHYAQGNKELAIKDLLEAGKIRVVEVPE